MVANVFAFEMRIACLELGENAESAVYIGHALLAHKYYNASIAHCERKQLLEYFRFSATRI